MPPSVSTVASTAFSQPSAVEKSAVRPFSYAVRRDSSMSATTTRAPSDVKAAAQASPIPPAPAISTRRSASPSQFCTNTIPLLRRRNWVLLEIVYKNKPRCNPRHREVTRGNFAAGRVSGECYRSVTCYCGAFATCPRYLASRNLRRASTAWSRCSSMCLTSRSASRSAKASMMRLCSSSTRWRLVGTP